MQINTKSLREGCGKEINHNIKNVIVTCGNSISYDGKLPNGIKARFLFRLCPTCQAHLSQYKSDLQQELEFLKNLKESELPSFFSQDVGDGYSEDFNYDYPKLDERINFIKKELENLENG